MSAANLIDLYMDELRERGRTDATVVEYRKNLTRADRELPLGLADANAVELRAWIHREGLSKASSRTYDAALRGFFGWREQAGLLEWNPMTQLKPPKVPEGLPRVAKDHQVRWAILETPDPLKLWAILAAYAGLRCIEISRLDRDDIGEHATTVRRGKGDKPRIVPTHPLVWACAHQLAPGPITELTAKQISLRFLQYSQRSGLRGLSMHRLRGWFCTNGYRASNDLLAMKRSMGHKRVDTTARYIDLTAGQVRAVVDGLPTFD
jgi:integrase/recombinase XerC